MTYPPGTPPTGPGYPTPQQPVGYGAPVPPSYPAPVAARPTGPAKSPAYLTLGVVVLGLAAYLASFGPLLSINTDIGPFGGAEFTASGLSYWTVAALVASLLAAVSMVPKSPSYTAIVAVAAILGVLLVIGQVVNRPTGFSIGWALWLVLGFTLLQSVAAVAAMLFESGVLSAPPPRPQYPAYGQYGPPQAGYYGQPAAPQGAPGQQSGYPGGYPGSYPQAGASGGYAQPGDDSPDTPPSGFPAYTPPSASGTQQAPDPSAKPSEPASGSTPS
ncbi:DUF5336 domain-containing protein [Mycolicibacterium sp.]|uniref:DUF5336 domain-containing protein n=1 Tax=Mycolicibacterium sp. TaxID=2320850 RepID=UPI001D749320|nr:DUF5336 domain-containing protein [Mycolicibacterium sp.]MCB1291484.1 DUF5336 domain-containing protein [Mycobacterium sp.]MCB9410360.1 DUF5336 domain-containing protein [Mycolicibacterium sp.]